MRVVRDAGAAPAESAGPCLRPGRRAVHDVRSVPPSVHVSCGAAPAPAAAPRPGSGVVVKPRRPPPGRRTPPRMSSPSPVPPGHPDAPPPAPPEPEPEAPAGPRRPAHACAEAIGAGVPEPVGADPGTVGVTRSVHHEAVGIEHCAVVPRRVAHVDHVGGSAVHLHESHVVQWRAWRNRVDLGRNARRDGPWTGRRTGVEPDAVLHGVERARTGLDDRGGRIRHVPQVRPLDRAILRIAIDGGRGIHRGSGPLHGRRQRDDVGDRRLLGLPGARHRGLDVLHHARVRNPGEVGRQRSSRHVGPWALRRPCAIPAARDQHVGVVIGNRLEESPGGVLDIQQLRPVDRHVVGCAVGDDELGGLGAHVDGGRRSVGQGGCRRGRVGRGRVEKIHLIVGHGRLHRGRKRPGRRRRHRPWSGERGRLHPAVEDMEIEPPLVLEQERPSVDHPLQTVPYGAQHRCTVDQHQDRRLSREEHARRRIPERLRASPGHLLLHGELRLQPVERDRLAGLREEPLQ